MAIPVGIYDKKGTPICEGDYVKINANWELGSEGKLATCVYSEQHAAYGLLIDYMGAERIYPFCQLCNVEYEVIDKSEANEK
jgi:hypothetical protein